MPIPLHKHFNQVSDKIIAVDEFVKRGTPAAGTRAEKNDAARLAESLAAWKDAGDRLYFSEMMVKTAFSSVTRAHFDIPGDFEKFVSTFEPLQKLMDACDDHRDRLAAGKLKVISQAERKRL